MPKNLGETLTFYMYESWDNSKPPKCKSRRLKYKSKATLCSDDGDYVYLLEAKMSSDSDTLCGMY